MTVNSNNEQQVMSTTIFFVASAFVLLPSYVLQGYFDIDVRILFATLTLISIYLLYQFNKLNISRNILQIIFALLIFGLVGSFFSGKLSQILMVACVSTSLVVISCGWNFLTSKEALKYQIAIAYALVFTSIIGFLYALSGGVISKTLTLQGGREVFLFFTTFTNSVNGSLIRPAGIFDEPGALAMFITLIVSINEAFGRGRMHSYILLLGGLVTGSFILFLITILFFIYKSTVRQLSYLLITLAVLFIVLNDSFFPDIIETFFVSRISAIEFVDGRLSGDSRSVQVYEFLDIVNLDMTLRGVEDRTDSVDQSSNPFSIYYGYGIFVWIPYLILELWLLYASFFYIKKLRFSALIIFLTLLQRPYIYNIYWMLIIILSIFVVYKVQYESHLRKVD